MYSNVNNAEFLGPFQKGGYILTDYFSMDQTVMKYILHRLSSGLDEKNQSKKQSALSKNKLLYHFILGKMKLRW